MTHLGTVQLAFPEVSLPQPPFPPFTTQFTEVTLAPSGQIPPSALPSFPY